MARLTRPLAALAVLATLAGPTLVVATASAPVHARPAPDRAAASWQDLDVWHLKYRTVRGRTVAVGVEFKGNRLDFPAQGLTAVAATADTAVVQHYTYDQDFGLGPLVELPATGPAGRSLDRHPVGMPLADPNGHVAFWSSRRSDGVHLVALDTSTGAKTVGPVVGARERVFAVEGATAYVVHGVGTADPHTLTWTPGQPGLVETPPELDHGGIVSDVSGDRVLSFDFDDGLYVTDRAGTLLRTLPLFFGTFSPDAAHVVGLRGAYVALYATETGAKVPLLGLRGRRPVLARWSPGGVLVVDTLRRGGGGDDAEPVLTFACAPADGTCRRLPGRAARFFLPSLPSDAFGQFLDYLPSD